MYNLLLFSLYVQTHTHIVNHRIHIDSDTKNIFNFISSFSFLFVYIYLKV